jgi:glutamyl-tRNA synthetase
MAVFVARHTSAVRVRIAPSPTGFAHLGTASTALNNVLFARREGGTFVLRVDDTDLQRNRDEYERVIYEALHWLGLDWDEGPDKGGPHMPYRQSERLELYREEADRLLGEGKAYRCYCTPEELDAERQQAQRERRPYVYSRRCLKDPPAGRTKFAIRFQVPAGQVTFTDMIRGQMSFDSGLFGDFIIVKSDGYPTYNFASPLDDAAMDITHVIRGEEHLPNTPYQLLIVDALGYDRPTAFAHLPLILAPDGGKLSKRKHPEANLVLYREQGYLPEAMLNYLALLGWNPGTEQEIFSFDQLVGAFSFDRVQHGGARFDRRKLDWIQKQYVQSLGDEELARKLEQFVPELDGEGLLRAAAPLKTRIGPLAQARDLLEYLWTDPPVPQLTADERGRLAEATQTLRPLGDWTPVAIHDALKQIATLAGLKDNDVFMPVRLAVTGKKVSPPIGDTLALLPKEVATARMERTL